MDNIKNKIANLEYEITTLNGKKFSKARKAIRNKIFNLHNKMNDTNHIIDEENILENLSNQLLLLTGKKNAKKRQELLKEINTLKINKKVNIESKKVNIESKKVNIESKKVNIENKKVNIENKKVNIENKKTIRKTIINYDRIKLYPDWYLKKLKW